MTQNRIVLAAASLLTCLAAAGTVAIAGASTSESAAALEAQAAEAEPVSTVPGDQAAMIGELRRGRISDDALPQQWAAELNQGDDAKRHWGANTSLSRRTAPGVWILPGNGYVCVVNAPPGQVAWSFGCATPEDVKHGLLAPSSVDENGNGVLTGVLPDGVTAVTLVDNDGSTRTVLVDRNTYRAAIDADLKEVRFTDAAGREHVLPMAWTR
jgi:hypothetical protein